MPSPQKFVLLSMPRTGSNRLATSLNSHPQIKCFRETFHGMLDKNSKPPSLLKRIDKKYLDKYYHKTHYMDYINTVFDLDIKEKFVGFKLMLGQHIKARNDVIEDESYKKILLYRENELTCYSSRLIAKETGQGNVKKGDTVLTVTVPFNPKKFEKFCKRRHHQYQKTRQLLAQNDQEYIDIEYKDSLTTEWMKKIITFIGADRNFRTESKQQKRNTSNIVERFTQPDEVMTYLKSIGKEEWAVEDIK